jgi:putative ABC transport system permease protein
MQHRTTGARWFRALLRLFPAEFRERFADDMVADFDDEHADAAARAGLWPRLRFWGTAARDCLVLGAVEHADTLRRDVVLSTRSCWRRPALAGTVVLTLGVTVAVAVTMFAVVDGVLLRPLSLPDGERLVRLYEVSPEADALGVSVPNFLDWSRARSLDAMALVVASTATARAGAYPQEVSIARVSAGFFSMFGPVIGLGRGFAGDDFTAQTAAEAAPTRVGIVSHRFWLHELGGRDVADLTLRLDGASVHVVGVLKAESGFEEVPTWANVDLWLPEVPGPFESRRLRYRTAVARLAAGVSLEQAQAELDTLAVGLAADYPEANAGWGVRVVRLLDSVVEETRSQLWFLLGAGLCVLAAGGANVTGLLVARAISRRADQDIRFALGASRARVVRESVTFGVVLTAAGGTLGLLLSSMAVPAVLALAPAGVPRLSGVVVGGRVVVGAVVMLLVLGAACGWAATWSVPLRAGSAGRAVGTDRSGRGRRFREVLVVGQTAVAFVLIVAAGLMLRTVHAVDSIELGFDPRNVISIGQTSDISAWSRARKDELEAALITRVQGLPEVVAAGVAMRPLGGGGLGYQVQRDDRVGRDEFFDLSVNPVSEGYFEALGVQLTAGRIFGPQDRAGGPRVALLNATAARVLWPGISPIGRSLRFDDDSVEVVGVVADIRQHGLEEPPVPLAYLLNRQTPNLQANNVLVRTVGDPAEVLPAVRDILLELSPEQALARVQTLEEALVEAQAPRWFLLRLAGLFAVVALGLALLGIYGVMAEHVAMRTPEIGIRMALGAAPHRVVAAVMGRGFWLIMLGVMVGFGTAASLSGLLRGLVFGVEALDLTTYAAVAMIVAAALTGATILPARRAATISPTMALKHQ